MENLSQHHNDSSLYQLRSKPTQAGLRMVAIFEGAKGVIVLAAGCGVLLLVHKDLQQAAEELIHILHLNPARKYPQIFVDLAGRAQDANLWAMASAAVVYSIVRFAEAVGLWLNRRWAEWFGVLTGGMYIPLEIYEVTRRVTWPRLTVLIVNATVVVYLSFVLLRRRRKAHFSTDRDTSG